MLEIDRQDVESRPADDGRSVVVPLDEIGDPQRRTGGLGASHGDTSYA